MTTSRRGLFRRGRHDSGASAVEYALILAGVALVGVATLYLLGQGIKGAFIAAEAQTESQPAGVLPDVGTTSAAPGTTSAAPTTSSAAPTTSSAAPTTSSAAPTTSSPPPGAETARRGRTTTIDPNLPNNADPRGTPTVTPDVGSVDWGNGSNSDSIVFRPDNNAPIGPVTITYQYRINGTTVTRTITVYVTA